MPATALKVKCFMCGKTKAKSDICFYHGKFLCCNSCLEKYKKKAGSNAKSSKPGVCEFC